MKEVDPKQTKRAMAFEMWMNAPMPMATFFKTLDVTNLVKLSRRKNLKFNMLMCWCIGKAASQTEEFYILPLNGKLVEYERIAVSAVIATDNGGISTCDIPFIEDLKDFNREYLSFTEAVRKDCQAHNLDDEYMVIGTSSLAKYDIDGAVNIYAGIYNNPFAIWGKYNKKFLKTKLSLSFQFHHTQMDGAHAAQFLECLQNEICSLKVK